MLGRNTTPDFKSIEIPHQVLCSGVVYMICLGVGSSFSELSPLLVYFVTHSIFLTVILLLAQLQVVWLTIGTPEETPL